MADTRPCSNKGVTELACLAHCRRKFFDLYAAGKHLVADEALRRIGELYAIAQRVRDNSVAKRLELRQQEAAPRLQAWREWLISQRLKTADGSGLARAIDYTLKRWEALARYVCHAGMFRSTTAPSKTPSAPLP